MHKIIFSIITISCLIPGFLLAENEQPFRNEIRIGAILPLSGDAQSFGAEARFALEHALHDTPHSKFRYRLIFEDDKLSSNQASSAAQKLISVDKTSVLFSNWSYGGNAVASVAKNRPVINLAFAWDREMLNVGSNNFLLSGPPAELAKKVIANLKSEGIESIALVGFEEAGVNIVFKEIELEAEKAHIKIVQRIQTDPAQPTDYRSIVTRLAQLKPQYLVTCLVYPQYKDLFKTLKTFRWDVAVASIGQTSASKELLEIKPSVWWNVDFYSQTDDQRKIRERTGLKEVSGYPGYYDGLRAIIEIYESAPGTEVPEISWVQKKLETYTRDTSLLGKMSFANRIRQTDQVHIIKLDKSLPVK